MQVSDTISPGPNAEDSQIAGCGNKKKYLTTQSLDEIKGKADNNQQRPYLEATVEERLAMEFDDARRVENIVKTIRDEIISYNARASHLIVIRCHF